MKRRLARIIKDVEWPDLEEDTVLNVFIMKQPSPAHEFDTTLSWPIMTLHAQGDDASEIPIRNGNYVNRFAEVIPEDMLAITFRIEILAGGVLCKEEPVFHISGYQMTRVYDD